MWRNHKELKVLFEGHGIPVRRIETLMSDIVVYTTLDLINNKEDEVLALAVSEMVNKDSEIDVLITGQQS